MIFVERGRFDCEAWYRASRTTVNRWLAERGKARLINLRAAFIRRRRMMLMPRKKPLAVAMVDRRPIDPDLARLAANHLRQVRNGGWIVFPTPAGDWWCGSVRRSPGQLVEFAAAKGFDLVWANLQLAAQRGVG